MLTTMFSRYFSSLRISLCEEKKKKLIGNIASQRQKNIMIEMLKNVFADYQ